jgi:transcriptional regulator with XRE-family HTH domain
MPPEGHFAQRLDRLFRTVHPKDRGPYTPAEVAGAINAEAGERVVSGTYLWLLRTGQRDNPTMRHLIAIARFFGVPPAYFFPDDTAGQGAVPAEVVAALSDDKVREMTLRAAGLSDRSLKAITDMINSARTVEGLPEDDASPEG